MMTNNTYYGSYRTRTFADIFPSAEEFLSVYDGGSGIPAVLQNTENANLLYYLLYARYGNSHIAYSDENQFVYALLSKIFQYGVAWEKRLIIQQDLAQMTEEDMRLGGEATYNSALNPTNAGSTVDTGSREAINYVNSQNKTLYTKTRLEGYANLLALLESDVTEDFLIKFRSLFIKVLAPDEPLLYATYEPLEV